MSLPMHFARRFRSPGKRVRRNGVLPMKTRWPVVALSCIAGTSLTFAAMNGSTRIYVTNSEGNDHDLALRTIRCGEQYWE